MLEEHTDQNPAETSETSRTTPSEAPAATGSDASGPAAGETAGAAPAVKKTTRTRKTAARSAKKAAGPAVAASAAQVAGELGHRRDLGPEAVLGHRVEDRRVAVDPHRVVALGEDVVGAVAPPLRAGHGRVGMQRGCSHNGLRDGCDVVASRAG